MMQEFGVRMSTDFGHPWTKVSDWDLAEMVFTSQKEVDENITKLELAGWHIWINGKMGEYPGCVMYKPSHATTPDWEDHPK